jgi:heat shock protein HslJ
MKRIYLLFSLASLIIISCSVFKKDNLPKIEEPTVQFINTKWMLTHINGKAVIINFEKPSFIKIVDDKSFKGSGGCNQIWGVCKQMNTAIQFSNIGRTKMHCDNMQTEEKLLNNLKLAEAYLINGNKLQLLTKDSKIILEFQAIEEKKQ